MKIKVNTNKTRRPRLSRDELEVGKMYVALVRGEDLYDMTGEDIRDQASVLATNGNVVCLDDGHVWINASGMEYVELDATLTINL